MPTATLLRRLVPAVLLVSLALASCERCKDHDPRPRTKCGTKTPPTTPPTGGNS